eukprot:2467797-Pyramimonas_sp.AAC.1
MRARAAQRGAARGGVSTVTTNYEGTSAFASTNRAALRAAAFEHARDNERRFAMAAIEHSTLALTASDGLVEVAGAAGPQTGFAPCPGQINDARSLCVAQLREEERKGPSRQVRDAINPTGGATCDFA